MFDSQIRLDGDINKKKIKQLCLSGHITQTVTVKLRKFYLACNMFTRGTAQFPSYNIESVKEILEVFIISVI